MAALALVALLGFGFVLSTDLVRADDDDAIQASGTFQTQQTFGPDCPSPIGLCAEGISTGTIEGDVFVVITSAVPDGNGNTNYEGTIEITGDFGTLNGDITNGTIQPNGDLNSTVTFDGIGGSLAVDGNIDFATGQEFDLYSGTLFVDDDFFDDDDDDDDDD